MGFHRRHINKKTIITEYNNKGLEGVRQLFFRRVDSILLEDPESSKVWEMLIACEENMIINYIEGLLDDQLDVNQ